MDGEISATPFFRRPLPYNNTTMKITPDLIIFLHSEYDELTEKLSKLEKLMMKANSDTEKKNVMKMEIKIVSKFIELIGAHIKQLETKL